MADIFHKTVHASRLITITAAVIAAMTLPSCSDNENFDELPREIQKFVALYYPEISVSSYSFNSGTYNIVLRNSATMTFNSSYQWISVNGRGATLPELFVYDRLPEALYDYLLTTSNTNNVYSASHNATSYTLGLLDSIITYDIKTASISYKTRNK